MFPEVTLANTSAKNETIDLNREKRFPTMTCRSIGGTLTGAVEIGEGGVLYSDDLIEDLEESLNTDRLQAKYDAYLNQLKDRKKDNALELMVGTRWNVLDPLGRIQTQYEGDPNYRFRVIPALDENDESNFDYDYGVGFSTEYYHDMRKSIDDATWWAKYMGQPYVREGLLFPQGELNYYNGVLPDGDCVKKAVCDVAWGGGDSLAMPFAYIYGDTVYIHDVIFNNGDKEITYYFHEKLAKGCHGTGDIYSSAFVGALMRGKTVAEAAQIAADFTLAGMKATQGDEAHWYGTKFEKALPVLMDALK